MLFHIGFLHDQWCKKTYNTSTTQTNFHLRYAAGYYANSPFGHFNWSAILVDYFSIVFAIVLKVSWKDLFPKTSLQSTYPIQFPPHLWDVSWMVGLTNPVEKKTLFFKKNSQSLSCIHFDKHPNCTNTASFVIWVQSSECWVLLISGTCVVMGRLLEPTQST